MMYQRADGRVATAPIGRFTELSNGTGPVKRTRRAPEPPEEDGEEQHPPK
jgi:hypothetical protein